MPTDETGGPKGSSLGKVSTEMIMALIDAVPFPIALLDVELRYLLVNRSVQVVTGITQDHYVGQAVSDIVADVPAEVVAAMRRAIAGETTRDVRLALELPTEPGVIRYLRGTVFPVYDDSGQVEAVAVCSIEVTEQVLAETLRDDAVRVAQEAASSATRLYGVARALASARSVDDIAAAVAAECAQPLSASASGIVIINDDGSSARFATVEGQLPVAQRWSSFELTEPLLVADAMRSGVARFDLEPASWPPPFDMAGRDALAAGLVAQASVPMIVSGNVLGALVLGWSVAPEFAEGERRFLETVAAQCAQALERVRLFELQQGAAETLQRSLLPQSLPTVTGIDAAAAYLPATEGLQVGGDWYDVIKLDDGTVLFSLGDVAGSGVPAAVVMGQLRNGLRAIALREGSPARLLDWLEQLLEKDAEELATLMLARLDPRTGEIIVANAGHLPPVLLPAHGPAQLLEIPSSPPLGVGTALAGVREDTVVTLPEGASLIFYTDGLVEVRHLSISLGIDQLREAVDVVPRGPDGELYAADLCEHVMVTVAATRNRSDDVAVLVVRREISPLALGPPVRPMVASLRLSGAETDVARARDWAAARLVEWSLSRMVEETRLVVSEMVTNALVHAGGAAELRLRRLHDGLRVEVEDRLANLPRVGALSSEATGGRGLLVVEALSSRWGSHAVPGGKIVWAHLAEV